MATAKLTILSESMKGTSFPLTEAKYVLGRTDSADICIQDASISSKHCVIFETENGTYALQDNDSTNGTWVNSSKLEGDAIELKRGDILRFGGIEVLYDYDLTPAEKAQEKKNTATHAASVVDLSLAGTRTLNPEVMQNVGNQVAAKQSVRLRENQKDTLIVYSILGVFGTAILAVIITNVIKMFQ